MNENAANQAKDIDDKRAKGEKLPQFAGIPVALKDLLITKGMPTTCSSKFLEGFKPPFVGTAVDLLEQSGFINLGKLSMDEFAMGSSNENAAFKKTRNPWDTEKVPGGVHQADLRRLLQQGLHLSHSAATPAALSVSLHHSAEWSE